jgi:protein TonB
MKLILSPRTLLPLSLVLLLGLLAGCASAPPPAAGVPAPAPMAVIPPTKPEPPMGPPSGALSAMDYRLDAAYHLYGKNNGRIYQGVMPHFLYAIGVLEVQVDPRGNLLALNWMRAPEHAPEVIAEIERTVRQAAPFPAPVQLGSASYIETWLWDASGNFQLHTLSEGQGPKGQPRRAMPSPRGIRLVSAPGVTAR